MYIYFYVANDYFAFILDVEEKLVSEVAEDSWATYTPLKLKKISCDQIKGDEDF